MSIFKTEKELEDQIYSYILTNKSNPINGREVLGVCKQPSLGGYGVADLITLEKHGAKEVINVIELKNVPFQASMIFQIGRYLAGVKLASNYEKLNSSSLNFDACGQITKMYENAEVIGSLVCSECGVITPGMAAVFSMLSVSVFSTSMSMLSVDFEQVTLDSDYDINEVPAIQSSISFLATNFENLPF